MWKLAGAALVIIAVSALVVASRDKPKRDAPEHVSTVAVTVPHPTVPSSPWQVSTTTDPIDDSATVFITQGFSEVGSVMIRCGPKKLDAYFNTPDREMLDTDELHEQRIRIRYGTTQPFNQTWPVADSFDALFSPSPATFLNSWASEGRTVIEYRTDGLTKIASFPAANLLELLRTNCPAFQRGLSQVARQKAQQKADLAESKRLCAGWKENCPYAIGRWTRDPSN